MEKPIKIMPSAPDPIHNPIKQPQNGKGCKRGCSWEGEPKLVTKIKVAA